MRLTLAVLALFLASPSFAQVVTSTPTVERPVSVVMARADLDALVRSLVPTAAGPVTGAVTTTTTATTTSPSFISADGIFGMSWWTLAGYLISALMAFFGIFKSGQYLSIASRVKKVAADCAEAAYLIAEKDFSDLSGEKKFAAAMGNLVELLAEHGLTATPSVQALASTTWSKLAAAPTQVQTPAPLLAVVATAQAEAEVAKKVAEGATAGELLADARKP